MKAEFTELTFFTFVYGTWGKRHAHFSWHVQVRGQLGGVGLSMRFTQ